ncbi:MAG: YtxH domain-containing protein [Syntrophaceae bacterium]|nr:YtxH domain-containing protein [Syntrophaceae bacterium]
MAANDWLKGLLVGGIIGAVLGILYAPKSGKETREDISKSAEELCYKSKEKYEWAIQKIEKLVDEGKDKFATKKGGLKKVIDEDMETIK